MLVEPLADVDVNVPGVMATLVAPAVTQLSVLLVPEFMLVGSAVKDAIVGSELFPEDETAEVDPQPASPALANRIMKTKTAAQISSREELRPRELSFFLQNEFVELMRIPFVAVATGHSSLVTAAILEPKRASLNTDELEW